MSGSTYRARLGFAAVLLTLTGCGGVVSQPAREPPTRSERAALPPQWACLARLGATLQQAAPGLPVALVGSGERMVVLSEESDENVCGWLGLVSTLRSDGFGVALYDFADNPQADLTAVVGYLHAHGTSTIELVGASEGAKASIIVGALATPTVAAVVSLSAEDFLLRTAVAPYAARLVCPVFFVTAAADPYGATQASQGYFRSAPSPTKHLLVVPGAAHGTALLSDSAVVNAITAFLESP